MLEQLSTFNTISVIAWVLVIIYFGPTLFQSWKGRLDDWLELGWLVAAVAMIGTILLRPDLTNAMIMLVFFPLLVLSLLERRSRKR